MLAAEATLSRLTWIGFTAESRSESDRGSDIQDARAGYDAGRVVPAVLKLIEEVIAVRRGEEPIQAALDRADTSALLDDVIAAGSASGKLLDLQQRLVRAWTVAAGANVLVQVAIPVLFLNACAGTHWISHTGQIVSGAALSGGGAILLVSLAVVRQFDRSLARAIREGKDAARGA